MNKFFFLILTLLLSLYTAHSQVGIAFKSGTVTASGQTIEVDVVVTSGFNKIVYFQGSVNWDASVFTFESIKNVTTSLDRFTLDNIGTPKTAVALVDGQLIISWNTPDDATRTLPDNTRLFTIVLNSKGANCTSTNVKLTNVPRVIEVAQDLAGSGDFKQISFTQSGGAINIDNGSCNGGGGGGGQTGVGIIVRDTSVTKGTTVCIPFKTQSFKDIESIQMGVTWDSTVLKYIGTGGLKSVGLSNVQGNFTAASRGTARILWSFDSKAVTLADGATMFELCYEVVGNTGASSDIKIVNLPNVSPPFNIEVTVNSKSVQYFTDDGKVTVGSGGGGGTDGVGFIAPDITTNGASTICIPVTTKNFTNIVGFGVGMNFDTTILRFREIKSVGLTNVLAGDSKASSGILRALWTDNQGIARSVADGATLYEVCFDVIGAVGRKSPFGFINIPPDFNIEVIGPGSTRSPFYLDDGSITVGSPPNTTPVVVTANSVAVAQGGEACVNFSVEGFSNVQKMSFIVNWDSNILQYKEVKGLGLPGLSQTNFTYSTAAPNALRFVYTPSGPQTVGPGSSMFQVCFTGLAACDSGRSSTVAVTGDATTPFEALSSGNTAIPVRANPGSVTAATCPPPPPVGVIDILSTTTPTCAGNVNGAILTRLTGFIGTTTCAWQNAAGQQIATGCNLNGVGAGEYTLSVTDANGTVVKKTTAVTQPSPIDTVRVNRFACDTAANKGAKIELVLTGGTSPFTLTSADGVVGGVAITAIKKGTINVLVEDTRGCQKLFENIKVQVCDTGSIQPPPPPNGGTACNDYRSVISPGTADNVNDVFTIGCLTTNQFLPHELTIYDRWGRLVYKSNAYRNDWKGTDLNGEQLAEGGYMWVLIIGNPGLREAYRGTVTILR